MSAPLFEVGRVYKTRDGRDARVICVDRKSDSPVLALVIDASDNSEGVRSYTSEGSYWGDKPCGLDLLTPDEVRHLPIHAPRSYSKASIPEVRQCGALAVIKVTYRAGKPISAEIVTAGDEQ